jgi:hypothetical protein
MPVPDVRARVLADYIRARALVGAVLLLPARRDSSEPLWKETARYWLPEGEKRAKLLRQRQGGWHAFRRAWATARKNLPL